ncbi:hypothetical protein [Paenibacillus aestuarii]|uniref:Glycosyltransferase family 2 protein n=1 Tax=Paenibacillus aestuarii TaxID=516965 RepID=A0ABW0KC68_9BACL|nr:hypothetical protein [Paenibacillus aestuarii]
MPGPGVFIFTCTNHPDFFMNILHNFRNQRYKRKELIIIINNDSMNIKKIEEYGSRLSEANA